MWLVKVHMSAGTVEFKRKNNSEAADEAEALLKDGVWIGHRLYPPSAIVFIEISEMN